jgi:protein-disulfide isomerase
MAKNRLLSLKNVFLLLAVIVVVVVLLKVFWPGSVTGEVVGDYGTVKLEFYVMSQCPYGLQVENAIAPVLEKLGGSVDFHLDFIAKDLGSGNFQSLHGQPEVEGNIVQLCAMKHNPDKYMEMVVCMNEDASAIPGNWEKCAKDTELNVENIKTCFEGDEGKELLSESIKKSNAANAGGSPTIFVNGEPYQGARDSLSFQRVLCTNLEGHPECEDLPECGADFDCTAVEDKIGICENPNEENAKCTYIDPVKVKLIVLNDENCDSCDSAPVVQNLVQIFPGVDIEYVDISDDEGKDLIDDFGITLVPAYILDSKLTETYSWKNNQRLRPIFEQKNDWYKIFDEATGASHFVSEELRQAFYKSIGVTLGDNKPQIDFFVMSYCPYGNQAEEAIKPLFQLLEVKADFNPHYVIYSNYRGGGPNYCLDDENKYCSMHGVQEMNQGIRELCVDKHLGIEAYFDFVLAMNKECSSSNADSCWEAVAEDLGLDVEKIKDCEQNEALSLAKKDKELGDTLGVSGSPTVFIDGEKFGGERSPEGYKQALCAAFDSAPSECSTVLEGTATTASGGCG